MGQEIGRAVDSRLVPHHRYAPALAVDSVTNPMAWGWGRLRSWTGLYPGEPETCRRAIRPFLRTMAFLGLMLEVFSTYRIEGRGFLAIALVAGASLPIHYLAPFRFKKHIFLAISAFGLYWVLDAQATVMIVALATPLILITRLPVRWGIRAAILAAVAIGFAFMRVPVEQSLIPSYVWTFLGSMFMFRIIIYMYELKHARAPEPWIDTVGYFFLLPNFCFFHFPVVDYRTFQRGFLTDDVHALQHRGLMMMLRGTIHLIAYRLIDQQFLVAPGDVRGPAGLASFLVLNYLLYLQVSGQFHMACGLLHLFGYKLPETHHRFLLATGFTDYWRRINIYWKDFMVRVFFNPIVFRMKRYPQPVALGVATALVFLATWALHAYQKFWLRGAWELTVTDSLFWGVLGGLVLVNVQLDARRARRLPGRAPVEVSTWYAVRSRLVHGLKIAGTFTATILLWSLWGSPSISSWLDLLRRGLGSL